MVELESDELRPLTGSVPSLGDKPAGCRFCTRCPHVRAECTTLRPPLLPTQGRQVACWWVNPPAGEVPS